jgi:hypothetical protein
VNKLRVAIVLLLSTGLLLYNVSTALAYPSGSSGYYGTVKLDGVNVPAGTQVFALINGIQYARSDYLVYNGDTVYSVDVPDDDPNTPTIIEGGAPGDTVVFYIGSAKADQTAPWACGNSLNLNLTANPGISLSVNKNGNGSGMVSSLPAGIDCGSICSAGFPKNTSVNLTAIASTGSIFTGWSGDCSGNNPCMVFMDDAKSITASFMAFQFVFLPLIHFH